MIELQRAKLGLPPAGVTPTNAAQSATGKNGSSTGNAASAKQPSPTEVAKATLLSEDAQMERFINRLQRRDRKKASTHHHQMPSSSGSTVPSALSRRMLQRQGVGYLDETVASVVSASADRFLATVLQQSIACRDQRLKGAAMTREAAKQRKRHLDDYDADNDDRKRRKESIVKAREDIALITIEQAEPPKKSAAAAGKSPAGNPKKGKKKKKGSKKPAVEAPTGPQAIDPKMIALAMEASEDEYDSIDEEEEYYQENVEVSTREKIRLKKSGDNDYDEEDEDEDVEEDEDDDTLLLRDIVRPLEAWKFHLNGKVAIETDDENDEFENNEDGDDAESTKTSSSVSSARKEQQAEEKGKSYNESPSAAANGSESGKSPSSEKKPSGTPNGNKNGASKKTTLIITQAPPTPTASSNPPTSS